MRLNPGARGVTGLETYLWSNAQSPLSGSTSIRGYPVTCTATPYEWTWSTGDGSGYTTAHSGAPPPGHALAHTYDTTASYTVSLEVSWHLVTNYGSGGAVGSGSTPYDVIEIRSVLTG